MSTPDLSNRATLVIRVVLTAWSGLAAWSFRAVFGDTAGPAVLWAVVVPVAAVAALGCLTVCLGRSIAGAGATILGILAVVATVAVVTRPGADVRLGPARLLTGEFPADPVGPELATVSAIAGLTALVAVRLALRARARLVSLAPPLCCLSLGLGLGAAVAPLPGWFVPAFAVTAAAVLLVGSAGPGRVGTGRVVVGTAIALVAVTVGTLLGPLATADRPPVSVQALVAAPVTPREDTNPLVRYLAMRNEIIQVKATGTASRRVDLIRMVTFDRFDGWEWSVGGDYRRAGTQSLPHLEPAGQQARHQRTVRLGLRRALPGDELGLPCRARLSSEVDGDQLRHSGQGRVRLGGGPVRTTRLDNGQPDPDANHVGGPTRHCRRHVTTGRTEG
jgi:hypothetical protein